MLIYSCFNLHILCPSNIRQKTDGKIWRGLKISQTLSSCWYASCMRLSSHAITRAVLLSWRAAWFVPLADTTCLMHNNVLISPFSSAQFRSNTNSFWRNRKKGSWIMQRSLAHNIKRPKRVYDLWSVDSDSCVVLARVGRVGQARNAGVLEAIRDQDPVQGPDKAGASVAQPSRAASAWRHCALLQRARQAGAAVWSKEPASMFQKNDNHWIRVLRKITK